MPFFSSGLVICVLCAYVYYSPPAAAKGKGIRGATDTFFRCAAPNPGRVRNPLHSFTYAFLNVQVTLPKESLSPSLTDVALSGSRRLPLMRVELVLFRSVTV